MKSCNLVTTGRAELSNGDTLVLPCNVNYYYITDDSQAKEAFTELLTIVENEKNSIAVDIETTGYDPYINDIVLLQIGTSDNIQYIFDNRKVNLTLLNPLFETRCWKIGHNIKFDAKFIKTKLKANISRFFDTFLAEKVIRGGSYFDGGGYALDAVLWKRLNLQMTLEAAGFGTVNSESHTEKVKKLMQQSFLSVSADSELSPAQLAYAAQDVSAETIFKLASVQTKKLQESGFNILFDREVERLSNEAIRESYKRMFPSKLSLWPTASLEFKFLEVVIDMELAGIGFSVDTHAQVMKYIEYDYIEYKKEFSRLLSKYSPQKTLMGMAAVNPNSPQDILNAFKYAKINVTDTNADTIEVRLKEIDSNTDEYKILKALTDYRTMSKLKQAFGEKLVQHVHQKTKRIHFDVQQVLDTGRISNSNPNLQQIPSKLAWKLSDNEEKNALISQRPSIRDCFIAKPGYRFIIYDYSQQELRIAASVSLDKSMLRAFAEKKELHSYSATLMYDEEYETFVKKVKAKDPETLEKRKEAKTVSFGALYGSGPANLSRVLHISFDKAKDIINRFWEAYHQLKSSMNRYGDISCELGYSNTVLGRRRYYTDIKQKIRWVELEENPATIQKKLEDLGMNYVLEKQGNVITEDNIGFGKQALVRKYKGDIARQAGNHVIQGTAADCTKAAAVFIRNEFIKNSLDAKIVGLVHDEIIVEVLVDHLEESKSIVEEKMKLALNLFCPNVPAEADGHVDTCWRKD